MASAAGEFAYLISGMDLNRSKRYNDQVMRWQKQITTIWSERSVYLISSRKNEEEVQWEDVVELGYADCNGERYSREFRKLIKTSKFNEIRIVWAILQESFPYGTFKQETKGIDPILPKWVSDCWKDLEEELLPRTVFSGMSALKQFLMKVESFHSPGCSLFFNLGGRGYFMGYGEKEIFVRVSRDPVDRSGGFRVLNEDWLHQTRMLYRNRTGTELKKLRVMSSGSTDLVPPANMPLVIDPVIPSDLDCNFAVCSVPGPIALIHTAVQQPDMNAELPIPILETRKNRIRMDSIYRWGAGLLLLGWITLLAGACKRTPPSDESIQLMQEWKKAESEWYAGHKRWERESENLEKSRSELLLIGSLGRTCPEPIRIDRIQILRPSGKPQDLKISLEGIINGEQESQAFHEWLSGLMDEGILTHVENLRFENKESSLRFIVEGIIR